MALKALHSVNIPKFTQSDTILFLGITNDLFPKSKIEDEFDPDFQFEIELASSKYNLVSSTNFIKKCVHLYETTLVRHGIIIVGPPCSGKSSVIEVVK